MKKIHLVVDAKDVDRALDKLSDLGALHVEHLSEFKGHPLAHQQEEVAGLENILALLKSNKTNTTQEECADPGKIIYEIQEANQEAQRLRERITKRAARIQQWEPWGDFDPQDIRNLARANVFVQLYEIPVSELDKLPNDIILEVIFKEGGIARCVVISQKDEELQYNRVALPSMGLEEKKAFQEAEIAKLEQAEKNINDKAKYIDALNKHLNRLKDQLTFSEVKIGMKQDERLSLLKGFAPNDVVGQLQEKAQAEKWGLLVEDVTKEDAAPTLLRNPKPVNLSKPALDMIEILPGYDEVDVSPVFIVFFTLFFGMLIGDAAYGTIFFVLTLLAQIKLKDKVKDRNPFYLMYLLSGFTILWGIATATYFGQQWLPAGVKPVLPWLNDFQNIQWLCFTIALVHLSIARLWSFAKKLPHLTAIAEIGWTLIIWGMYFLANVFVLNKDFPSFALWFFVVGIGLAFIFMVPFKYFLKQAPQETIPFVLSVVGAGTDIISYIRLFAVGLATVAVADAANSMPQALPGVVGYTLMVFLHALNLILATMAILVHAIRLNVLEFSGHLSLEWSGFRYNPFNKSLKQA